MNPSRALLAVAVALAVLLGGAPASYAADRTRAQGPALSVTPAQVRAALTCSGPISRSSRPPVLLLHGTTSNPRANWSWNWVRALDARGWGHCELALPDSGNADIQVGAEYVVRSIRMLSRAAGGRRIDVVGHSQGGMIGRWALKYWPDTRRKVDDYVGLASSNHGTQVFNAVCAVSRCSAANWQQLASSQFLRALNSGRETYRGVSYTAVSTSYDEVVVPSTSAHLRADRGSRVTNTSVQELCPLEVVDHFGMAYSSGAWAIGLDALTHRGPAKLSRVSRSACSTPLMPGVDPVAFPANVAAALAQTAASSAATPKLPAEPPLKAYAR